MDCTDTCEPPRKGLNDTDSDCERRESRERLVVPRQHKAEHTASQELTAPHLHLLTFSSFCQLINEFNQAAHYLLKFYDFCKGKNDC